MPQLIIRIAFEINYVPFVGSTEATKPIAVTLSGGDTPGRAFHTLQAKPPTRCKAFDFCRLVHRQPCPAINKGPTFGEVGLLLVASLELLPSSKLMVWLQRVVSLTRLGYPLFFALE
jgi:hypothetical protein